MSVRVLAAELLVQFTVNVSGKAMEDGSSASGPAAHVGNLVEYQAPGLSLAQPLSMWPLGE